MKMKQIKKDDILDMLLAAIELGQKHPELSFIKNSMGVKSMYKHYITDKAISAYNISISDFEKALREI